MSDPISTDPKAIITLLEKGLIPVDDPVWELIIEAPLSYIKTEPIAMSVAHHATVRNLIPKNGPHLYQIKDEYGWTVAHVAAAHGYLPEDFDQWELCNISGWTVAHEAARYNSLPKYFDKWELATKNGYTVRNIHDKYNPK